MNMKIGKFSEKNNVSIDTIRHYIEMKLIMPKKYGGQYVFDENCQDDLDGILQLKELGFTLTEIKHILLYQSLGKLDLYESYEGYKSIFYNKYEEVLSEISRLNGVKDKLKDKIESFEIEETNSNKPIGLSIKYISLLRCLKCNGDLELEDGNIKSNVITSGILKCNCGNEYLIKDGILIVDNETVIKNNFKIDYRLDQYINETDEKYISNLKRSLNWVSNKLSFTDFNNKVVLELGSGYGFLLRSISEKITSNTTYIAIDNNINRHLFLKELVRKSNINKNVVFICADLEEIPIKNNSVDILLDYSGSSNYWFENDKFTLDFTNNILKKNALLVGGYILFRKFSYNSFIKEENRKYFTADYIKRKLKTSVFNIVDQCESEGLTKPSLHEDYFKENEEVFSYLVFGERWG